MEINDKDLVLTEKNKEKKDSEVLKKTKNDQENMNWIKGEYKWVSIGTAMPSGWNKVEISKGFTLVEGVHEGETIGDVKIHTHPFEITNMYPLGPINSAYGEQTLFPASNYAPKSFIGVAEENEGDDSNLGAGINAELWQYEG